MLKPGRITEQIIREIKDSDVLIADLSESNPNVMYELGIRQAMMKPYILMAEMGQKLPFDLSDLRTIFYKLDLDNVEKSQEELRTHLERAMTGEISLIDQQFFGNTLDAKITNQPFSSTSASFEILEACQKILQEVGSVKDLVYQVGGVTLELKEKEVREMELRKEQHNHELGMAFFTQLFQHPDSMGKMLEMIQQFNTLNNPPESQ